MDEHDSNLPETCFSEKVFFSQENQIDDKPSTTSVDLDLQNSGADTNSNIPFPTSVDLDFQNSGSDTKNSNKLEAKFQELISPEFELQVAETEREKCCSMEEISGADSEQTTFEIEPYDFKHIPYQITGAWKDFKNIRNDNFTKGCKWAPDGSCILTCSDDNILRFFNLPNELYGPHPKWEDFKEMEAVISISEGERIYDYCWYPLMSSYDVATCCLASTSRNSPVHLLDAFTGELRCSYRSYDQMAEDDHCKVVETFPFLLFKFTRDEVIAAHSVSFSADSQKLFCGFDKMIRIFDVSIPGRTYEERPTFVKKSGQCGIISCFAFTPQNHSFSAAGSYGKTIGIYSEPSGYVEHILYGQKRGVTQLHISPDGTYLYSGGRKDPEILCWDMRNLGSVLFSLRRTCLTNQRIYFDVSKCGRYVVSGNQNGLITFWDTTSTPKEVNDCDFSILEPIQYYQSHNDCVNGVSLHPSMPLLCSCSGERMFLEPDSDEESERLFRPLQRSPDHSLRLWWIGQEPLPIGN